MECKTVRNLLSSLLDGELPRAERTQVLWHLCRCAKCRRELEGMLELDTRLLELNDKLSAVSTSGRFTEKVMNQIPSSEKENVLFFLKDLQQSDSSVLDDVAQKGEDGIMEHAKRKNITFSMPAFKKVLLEINDMSDNVPLSEDELAQVVGGVDHTMDIKTLSQRLLELCSKHDE